MMDTYISRGHNTATRYIATRPIIDLCLEVECMPFSLVPKWWWEQVGLYFVGRREAVWEDGCGD